jgi:hypothetical protein
LSAAESTVFLIWGGHPFSFQGFNAALFEIGELVYLKAVIDELQKSHYNVDKNQIFKKRIYQKFNKSNGL